MDRIVIRGGTSDLIAYAVYRVGFWPTDSVVVVGLRGSVPRTGLVARFDLPGPRALSAATDRVAGALDRAGDDRALVLLFCDRRGPGGDPLLPLRGLAAALHRRLTEAGIDVLDVVAVGASAYRSYRCGDPRCCPAGGTPIEEVLRTATAAQMVLSGRYLAGDPQELVADVEPEVDGSPGRRAVLHALRTAAPVPQDGPSRLASLHRWRSMVGRHAADREQPAPADLAALITTLADPIARDCVLLTLVGPGTLPEDLAAETGTTGDPADEDPAGEGGAAGRGAGAAGRRRRLAEMLATPPREDLVHAGRPVLTQLARTAPVGRRGDVLAVLAWLAWWTEGGALARLLAEASLLDDPGQRLATLVTMALDNVVAPAWVRAGS